MTDKTEEDKIQDALDSVGNDRLPFRYIRIAESLEGLDSAPILESGFKLQLDNSPISDAILNAVTLTPDMSKIQMVKELWFCRDCEGSGFYRPSISSELWSGTDALAAHAIASPDCQAKSVQVMTASIKFYSKG